MSPTNARALNTMRQRMKKHNPMYQTQMDAFREKPESSEEEAVSGALCWILKAWPGGLQPHGNGFNQSTLPTPTCL